MEIIGTHYEAVDPDTGEVFLGWSLGWKDTFDGREYGDWVLNTGDVTWGVLADAIAILVAQRNASLPPAMKLYWADDAINRILEDLTMLPEDVETLIADGYWGTDCESKGVSQCVNACSGGDMSLEDTITLCVNNWGGSWDLFWRRMHRLGYKLAKVQS